MAHTQPQPLKLFASDIAQYSDAELDQYLEFNGRSGWLYGAFYLDNAKAYAQMRSS